MLVYCYMEMHDIISFFRKCLAVVFLPIIQREADSFVAYWNSHHIRPSRMARCPSGRPDDMYDMPIHYGMYKAHLHSIYPINFTISIGAVNCLQPINKSIYHYAEMQAEQPPPHFDHPFFDRCNAQTTHVFGIDLFRDISPFNCIQLYKYLVNNVRSRIWNVKKCISKCTHDPRLPGPECDYVYVYTGRAQPGVFYHMTQCSVCMIHSLLPPFSW